MFYPSKNEYLKIAEDHNLIPVYKEYIVDTETPTSIFVKTGGLEKYGFLLESIEGSKNLSRYSFIGVGCDNLIKFDKEIFTLRSGKDKSFEINTVTPLLELEKIMKKNNMYKNPELDHFVGGAVGYLSYDMVKYFDQIPVCENKLSIPEIMLYLTDLVVVFDHLLNRMKIISTIKIRSGVSAGKTYDISVEKIKSLEKKITEADGSFLKNGFNSAAVSSLSFEDFDLNSNFRKEKFLTAVKQAKKYITEGETLQIVLSQRFYTSKFADPFSIYRGLRTINPSPYMYYFNFGDLKIIGASPEPLIKINGRKILTCPIAGTRRRGRNSKEDGDLANDLLNDKKEKAEHNMLVDLSRNDLGRVCKYGSVKVKEYMSVERYSHVMHLVSKVEGTLGRNNSIYDAFRSVFPAGTLSGAPKIRAMQIISELEPDSRGPYGGAVGYFGYDGNLDSCITIRTAIIRNGTAYIQAGAGIVYDSIPENEFNETVSKAAALFKAIGLFK
jgi:anthranilate synthase component 1